MLSLEFAAKVIHGSDLPAAVLKSRARRLYDVANVLTSFPEHRRLFVKAGYIFEHLAQHSPLDNDTRRH